MKRDAVIRWSIEDVTDRPDLVRIKVFDTENHPQLDWVSRCDQPSLPAINSPSGPVIRAIFDEWSGIRDKILNDYLT